MHGGFTRQTSVVLVIAKTLVVLLVADGAVVLFHGYHAFTYAGGLCLGILVQLVIPPRNTWKKQILVLMPIAVLIGLALAVFN